MLIRRERLSDHQQSRAVQVAAFASSEGAEPVEAGLLDRLRIDGWLPALSWVAELDGEVVGHGLCTRAHVGSAPAVGLGPIGVRPDHQRSGVGSALVHAMVGAADATGEPLIALLGNPDYYGRFGFGPASEVGIEPPDPAWGRFFQVLTLSTWKPEVVGRFRYAAPFDDVD